MAVIDACLRRPGILKATEEILHMKNCERILCFLVHA
jgi:hypothetical protein